MKQNVPRLLSRFNVCYCREANCIEYFLVKRKSGEQISRSLVYSLNSFSKQINVAKFYPEIRKERHPRYLSAACFYLLVHHFAHCLHLSEDYKIFLMTTPTVYDNFYARLQDFELRIQSCGLGDTVCVCSAYCPLDTDTGMVVKKSSEDEALQWAG